MPKRPLHPNVAFVQEPILLVADMEARLRSLYDEEHPSALLLMDRGPIDFALRKRGATPRPSAGEKYLAAEILDKED